MIDRIHLKIMAAIDRHGSLTAAAESLYLTQSALSHTMKKLEQQTGVTLWHKEGRQLRFTQAGEYLLQQALRLSPQLERVDQVLKEFADGDRGTLRIGMECHPCYIWLLTVVNPFLKAWPNIDVDVKQRFKFGGMAALFQHDIDLLVTPDPLLKKGVEFIPVFDYEQVLVLSTNHPLTKKAYVTPKDLSQETLYTYPVETERLDIFKDFLLPANTSPLRHKTLEATEIMLEMVAAERGVATLPLWLVQTYQDSLPITYQKLGKSGLKKQIYLGMRSNEDRSFTSAFIQMARASVESEGSSI